MDQARSRWEGGEGGLVCGAVGLGFGERRKIGGGGAYYFEDVGDHFGRWDVAVFLEELAGLGTDGFELGLVPLHVFVLRFDLRVDFWCGHAREGEGQAGQ